MSNLQDKKIAIVYDWLDSWGGVERVLQQFLELFPQANWYTAVYDKKKAQWLASRKVTVSFLHYFPSWLRKNRLFTSLFMPYAFESFDLSDYDIVISVSSAFAKGVITKPGTFHIGYILTPPRYLWSGINQYGSIMLRTLSASFYARARTWDFLASKRPDVLLSISNTVADRVKKYYREDANVLYPGIDTDYWDTMKRKNDQPFEKEKNSYFLCVSRLVPYKKIDLLLKTFATIPKEKLIIVGQGSEERKLQSMATANCHFLGFVSDQKLSKLYSGAKALIIPQEEDYGLVALEALYHDCPVIAYEKGGAKEIIIDGKTGILFGEQSVDGIRKAIARFHTMSYNEYRPLFHQLANKGAHFTKYVFQEQWRQLVSFTLKTHSLF